MSIADKITRLATAHDAIITALTDKGVTATGHGFEDFPTDIGSISSGGASNVVTGSFTTNSTTGEQEITIPYTGNGHLIMLHIVVDGGTFGDNTFGQLVAQNAVGEYSATKNRPLLTPSYNGTGNENQAAAITLYKSSASSYAQYDINKAMTQGSYNNATPTAGKAGCVTIKSKNKFSVFVRDASYGFVQNMAYKYYAEFSE